MFILRLALLVAAGRVVFAFSIGIPTTTTTTSVRRGGRARTAAADGSSSSQHRRQRRHTFWGRNEKDQTTTTTTTTALGISNSNSNGDGDGVRHVFIVGAGWGGLSAAWALSKEAARSSGSVKVTIADASPRVGGLVRDGFATTSGTRPAEAGQHGFWNNYHNIHRLLRDELSLPVNEILTDRAEQGQYSPMGLQAVWPVYRDQPATLPTGLAQAAYTRFASLSWLDRLTALPLALAFAEFDASPRAWEAYDRVSFRDLCVRLGVSRACYERAFEPMVLTGLFAPGAECSAAAALGMAYFFVLQSQNAFDVQWCRGNIGTTIFDPWLAAMAESPGGGAAAVTVATSTRVTGFELDEDTKRIKTVQCITEGKGCVEYHPDDVIFAVGAKALNAMVTNSPPLAQCPDLRRFANLRGTSVLATRIFLDQNITLPYSANACEGFDKGIGMTLFDIRALHGNNATTVQDAPGAVLEVDYYHASNLLVMSDDDIVKKVKDDLDTIVPACRGATVIDAAIVRLPQAVNWYYPGSYRDMPDVRSSSIPNLYFSGDIVRTRHGSWSQERAYVTGIEAANAILGKPPTANVIPVSPDEPHVAFGKQAVAVTKQIFGGARRAPPSLVDFLW